MIDVQELYLNRQDLLRKDHAGWISGEEYNRRLVLCQEILFDYYVQMTDERRKQNALAPFLSEKQLPKVDGFWQLPADFKEIIEIWAAQAPEGCKPDEAQYRTVDIPAADELGFSINSPIRGYSEKRGRYGAEVYSTRIRVWPTAFSGFVKLRYYREPATPNRSFTYDPVEVVEEYDSTTSTQLEWPPSEMQEFLDLLLLFDGVVLRDTALYQWVASRNVIEQQKMEGSR
jgi:hypothetical protein